METRSVHSPAFFTPPGRPPPPRPTDAPTHMLQLGSDTATRTYSRGQDEHLGEYGPSLRGLVAGSKRPATPDQLLPRPSTADGQLGQHRHSMGLGGPSLPGSLMDVVVLRRQFDGSSGVSLQSTACSFGGGSSASATVADAAAVGGFMRQGPMVSLGLNGSAHDKSRRQSDIHTGAGGGGSSTTALKNRLAQMRQMLEEAKRRIRVLEDARRNDQKLYAKEMQMQADLIRSDAAAEIRRLKERTKINSGALLCSPPPTCTLIHGTDIDRAPVQLVRCSLCRGMCFNPLSVCLAAQVSSSG